MSGTAEPMGLRLLPITALLRREVVTSLRRPRAMLLVGGTTAAFLLWFLYLIPKGNQISTFNPQMVLGLINMGVTYLTMILIPPLTVFNVRDERQRETLDLLMMSLVRPSFILFGKLISTGALYVLTLIALLPIFGVSFFFVGLDISQFVYTGCATLLNACLAASIAAWCAVTVQSSIKAIVTAYILIGFVYFNVLAGLGAFLALNGGLPWIGTSSIWLFVPIWLFVIALSLTSCARKFRMVTAPPPPPGERPIDDAGVLLDRRLRYPFYLIDPRRRKPLIRDGQNPVFRRELITSPFSQASMRVRLAVFYTIFAVPAFLLSSMRFAGAEISASQMFFLHSVVVCFLTPAFAATLMVKEHEQDNLDMLRMTLLSPFEVIRGKVLAGLSFMLPVLIAPLFGAVLVFVFNPDPLPWLMRALMLWLGLLNLTFFLSALTLAATMTARRTVTALFAGFLAPFVLIYVIPNFLIEAVGPGFSVLLWPSPVLTFAFLHEAERNLGGNLISNLSPYFLGSWTINQLAYLFWTAVLLFACNNYYVKKLQRDA